MILHDPQRMRAAVLLGTFLALHGVCDAGHPAQHPAAVGCKHHVHKGPPCHAGPGCFAHFWRPLPPPLLPVIPSQAIRTLPAEAEPMRMRLQLQVEEAPRPIEPFRRDDEDRPREPFRHQDQPFQKGLTPAQRTHYLIERPDVADFNERFDRIERQIDFLLQRLDGQQRAESPRQLTPLSR